MNFKLVTTPLVTTPLVTTPLVTTPLVTTPLVTTPLTIAEIYDKGFDMLMKHSKRELEELPSAPKNHCLSRQGLGFGEDNLVTKPNFNWVKGKIINPDVTTQHIRKSNWDVKPEEKKTRKSNWDVKPTSVSELTPVVSDKDDTVVFKISSSLSENDIQKFLVTLIKSGIKNFDIQYN